MWSPSSILCSVQNRKIRQNLNEKNMRLIEISSNDVGTKYSSPLITNKSGRQTNNKKVTWSDEKATVLGTFPAQS